MNLFTIVYLISNFIIVLAINRFMDVCFEKRRTPLYLLIASFALYYVSTSLGFMFLDMPAITTIIGLLFCFIITLNYEGLIRKKIATVFSFYILLVSTETIVSCPFSVLKLRPLENMDYQIISLLVTGILLYGIMFLSRNLENMKKSNISSPAFWNISVIITGFLLILLYLSIFYLPQIFATLAAIMITTITMLSFNVNDILSSMYEERMRSALHTQEKEYYYSQCLLMQESIDKVKSIRHDMNFHLVTTRNFTASNNPQEATEYLDGLLGDIKESKPYSDTGNIAFDSIINYKLRNAEDENIEVKVNIFIPPILNIEVRDAVTILGNLLDNALKAVALVDNKIITLDIESRKGNLYLKITNTFNPKANEIARHSSEKESPFSHKEEVEYGYGLRNVKKAVDSYNGLLDITVDGDIFSVGILLYTAK